MTVRKGENLNRLLQALPPGLLVDAQWLERQGLSRSRVSDYVQKGWLERLAPRVYRRPSASGGDHQDPQVRWELAVVSAQALVEPAFHVGGGTALDLLGLSHFLDLGGKSQIVLYDADRTAPSWLFELNLGTALRRVARRLFASEALGVDWRHVDLSTGKLGPVVQRPQRQQPWDQFLHVSSAERAILELLHDVGTAVGFQTADHLFEGLATLRPSLLTKLLRHCTSIRAKRLFLFYADRHRHSWAGRIDRAGVDLGTGKRQIAKGGRLDPAYQITVPAHLLEEAPRA